MFYITFKLKEKVFTDLPLEKSSGRFYAGTYEYATTRDIKEEVLLSKDLDDAETFDNLEDAKYACELFTKTFKGFDIEIHQKGDSDE